MHKISFKRMHALLNKLIMQIDDQQILDEVIELYNLAETKEDLDDIRQICVAYRRYIEKQKIVEKRLKEFKAKYTRLKVKLIAEQNDADDWEFDGESA